MPSARQTPPGDEALPSDPHKPIDAARVARYLAEARSARLILQRVVEGLGAYEPRQITDVAGNSFLALTTPQSTGSVVATEGVPFSIATFTDDLGVAHWIPAPSSVLGYDGDYLFTPFDPDLEGIPMSAHTRATAPVVPEEGVAAYLEFALSFVSGPTTPAVVKFVYVHTQDPSLPPPPDNLAAGTVYRPWFTLSPAVEGVRTLEYQTLGYCHFWLFAQLEEGSSSPSSSSSESSPGGPPPPEAAAFPMKIGRHTVWPTWGLVARRVARFRVTLTGCGSAFYKETTLEVPTEFTQCVQPASIRVVHAAAVVTGRSAFAGELPKPLDPITTVHRRKDGSRFIRMRTDFAFPSNCSRHVSVTLEGLPRGAGRNPQLTDAAGRARNKEFWSGDWVPTPPR